MNLELSESFQSENDRDLNIKVWFSVNEKKISDAHTEKKGSITISDDNFNEYQKSITLTIKEFEKVLCIYDAFLASKEATGHDLERLKQI